LKKLNSVGITPSLTQSTADGFGSFRETTSCPKIR